MSASAPIDRPRLTDRALGWLHAAGLAARGVGLWKLLGAGLLWCIAGELLLQRMREQAMLLFYTEASAVLLGSLLAIPPLAALLPRLRSEWLDRRLAQLDPPTPAWAMITAFGFVAALMGLFPTTGGEPHELLGPIAEDGGWVSLLLAVVSTILFAGLLNAWLRDTFVARRFDRAARLSAADSARHLAGLADHPTYGYWAREEHVSRTIQTGDADAAEAALAELPQSPHHPYPQRRRYFAASIALLRGDADAFARLCDEIETLHQNRTLADAFRRLQAARTHDAATIERIEADWLAEYADDPERQAVWPTEAAYREWLTRSRTEPETIVPDEEAASRPLRPGEATAAEWRFINEETERVLAAGVSPEADDVDEPLADRLTSETAAP